MGAVVDAKQLLGVHVLMFTHTHKCVPHLLHTAPPLWQPTSIVPFPPAMTQMTHDD